MYQFGTSAFNTVGHWRELGEVEDKYKSHKFTFLLSVCQTLSTSVEIWQSYGRNNFAQFFWDTVYTTDCIPTCRRLFADSQPIYSLLKLIIHMAISRSMTFCSLPDFISSYSMSATDMPAWLSLVMHNASCRSVRAPNLKNKKAWKSKAKIGVNVIQGRSNWCAIFSSKSQKSRLPGVKNLCEKATRRPNYSVGLQVYLRVAARASAGRFRADSKLGLTIVHCRRLWPSATRRTAAYMSAVDERTYLLVDDSYVPINELI